MAMFWRQKFIGIERETTYGSAAAIGSDAAILAKEVSLSPMEGNDVDRELELPYFGGTGTIPTELHVKLTFKVELTGSGTVGLPPAWGRLLRMCGCAETIVADTSVAYNPITDGQESGTVHFFIDSTRHTMLGTRGTAKFELEANRIPYITFELTGLFAVPTQQTRPTADLTSWPRPFEVNDANSAISIGGNTDLVMRSFMLDLQNEVAPRFLVGKEEVLITNRREMIDCTIEATPVTAFDPYTAALNQSELAMTVRHGGAAGVTCTFNILKAQMKRPEGIEETQGIAEWPLKLEPIPTAGNDQWTLTLT